MKKLSALLLALLICLSMFAGCGGDNAPAKNDGKPSAGEEAPATPDTTPDTTPDDTQNPDDGKTPDDTQPPAEPEIKTITVAEALKIAEANEEATTERYYIRAIVQGIENPTYGQMTIADETGSILVYGTYSEDGSIRFDAMTEKPKKGDEVLIYGTLQNYKGNTLEVANARLISFTANKPQINESDYTQMTIAQARDAETGKLVKVTGTVACITYANGQIPSGVYLVDKTNSIYVFDRDLASQVSVGNTVTVAGSKTMWILEKEASNATKYGYKGCCQIETPILLENDLKTTDFDKSWITETTLKDILDTPVTENITTTIYKITAKVVKTPGTGFVNYYFYDLDEKTSAYTYTQCNGKDFEWLDAFDGKVCTVYISAINAKSEASACFFRLLPVAVIDEGFKFDTAKAAEFAVKYHGIGQFETSYASDPSLELVSSVSSTLLGFENATLTYTSSNTANVSFATENGKTVMHTAGSGKATVTVTGAFGGKEYSETLEITVSEPAKIDSITVKQAIEAADKTEVTVKGIVGPSLVNQSGFYLVDETGIVAILMDKALLAEVKQGQEVILKGVRTHRVKENVEHFGQTVINECQVVANLYGEHQYSTATFITDKTFADFCTRDAKQDLTTQAYVVTAKLTQPSKYTLALTDGTNSLTLYTSSVNQYSWLLDYVDKDVTVELMACDWNSKGYKGCVLALVTANGKTVNALNFAQ